GKSPRVRRLQVQPVGPGTAARRHGEEGGGATSRRRPASWLLEWRSSRAARWRARRRFRDEEQQRSSWGLGSATTPRVEEDGRGGACVVGGGKGEERWICVDPSS
ncbi:hypothetical protein Tsubulata_040907, partial [Turnera subulata]